MWSESLQVVFVRVIWIDDFGVTMYRDAVPQSRAADLACHLRVL